MKITVEIPDVLVGEARSAAQRQETTLSALVERGLRRVLRDLRAPEAFRLRDASFRGRGLQPAFREAGWRRILEAAYEKGSS